MYHSEVDRSNAERYGFWTICIPSLCGATYTSFSGSGKHREKSPDEDLAYSDQIREAQKLPRSSGVHAKSFVHIST